LKGIINLNTQLFLAAILFAILDWIAVARNWKKVEYFSKPGVMITILAWLILIGNAHPGIIYFCFGIFFSLAGISFSCSQKNSFLQGWFHFYCPPGIYWGIESKCSPH